MSWFDQVKSPKLKTVKKTNTSTPTGLWKKCVSCGEILQNERLLENQFVCPYCNHHFRMSAKERLDLIIDQGSFKEFDGKLATKDPLGFSDKMTYKKRLEKAFERTSLTEGTLAGSGSVHGNKVSIGVMNFNFMGGSMGVATGESIARVYEHALDEKVPAIIVSSSGGARMQEGILSLMQMGKTSALISKLKKESIPYISVLTDPTTGGVAASFAMLGDVILAEPKALIGFAGPRVIEQSIRQKLPEGFQRSEFLLEHGFVDRVVHRHKLKDEIAFFSDMFDR